MGVAIILIVREALSSTPSELVSANDKRKNIIQLFSSISGYPNNITMKKISNNNMTYDEMDTFYTSVCSSLADDDIVYFVDDRSSCDLSSSSFNTLNTSLTTLLTSTSPALAEGSEGDDSVAEPIDIMYLAASMDNCNTMSKIYDASPSNITFYKSKSPKGMFCVVSTKKKFGEILTKMNGKMQDRVMARLTELIIEEEIVAATTWPRVVTPNIFMLETNTDNLYASPCRIEDDYGRVIPDVESVSMYWFLLGTIVMVLGYWYVTKINDKPKPSQKAK